MHDVAPDDTPMPSDAELVPAPARLPVRTSALTALLLLVPVPSIGVALALGFPATQGTLAAQIAFGLGKVWLIVFPALWWKLVDRRRWSLSPAREGGFAVASLLGLAICGVIAAAYVLVGPHLIDPAEVREKAAQTDLAVPWLFIAFATYTCTINAVLEEYVWRWFVFDKCRDLLRGRGLAAVFLSAAFFTVHHVVALGVQFDWDVTLLASAGVFIGGSIWSWCYLRYKSIWPGYVSHVLVDIAVFWIGWRIIFG